MTPRSLLRSARRRVRELGQAAVERGLPPSWVRYRWVERESVAAYHARNHGRPSCGRYETIHPEAVADNPLPRNIDDPQALPDVRGWWHFSFQDVPNRVSDETFIATLPSCRVVSYRDPALSNDFYPAILTADDRGLELREIRFRPGHATALRRLGPPIRLRRATWILERVYHNHSHWLTAHLPKLALLRDRDELDHVLLPEELTPAIEGSLRLIGLDPDRFRRFDPTRSLEVDELTVLGTDRFRPELLRPVQTALSGGRERADEGRRVYISRSGAARRRLLNEEALWPLLERHGFERVRMEQLTFEAQVQLMRETDVLVAPHGAGLTNMMSCPPGTHVVEIADLSFPNPNFYALASALGHPYWLVEARGIGDVHPLEKDLHVDVDAVDAVLRRLPV